MYILNTQPVKVLIPQPFTSAHLIAGLLCVLTLNNRTSIKIIKFAILCNNVLINVNLFYKVRYYGFIIYPFANLEGPFQLLSDHVSNFAWVNGNIPEDKLEILKDLDKLLAVPENEFRQVDFRSL